MRATYNEETHTYTVEFDDAETSEMTEEQFKERFVECCICGEWIEKEDAVTDVDGNVYCESCADEETMVCENCGDRVPNDKICNNKDTDEFFCSHCANRYWTFCERCSEYHNVEECVQMEDSGEIWCYDCANTYAHFCDVCERWFQYRESMSWDDCSICEDCADQNRVIQEYHTSKDESDYNFYHMPGETAKSTPYMGFELEVDNGSDPDYTAGMLQDAFGGFFFFEHDGSLSNGFEIISNPATLAYHLQNNYEELRRICVRNGFTSHNAGTCGLHIHVDRRYFDKQELGVAKLAFLMERFWDNMVIFSRRKKEQLHWANRYSESPREVAKMDKDDKIYDRYFAINLENYNTIEFRLWRGTLNIKTLHATLKFTARLCEIAKHTPVNKLYKMKWDDVLGDDPDIRAYWESRVGTPIDENGISDDPNE